MSASVSRPLPRSRLNVASRRSWSVANTRGSGPCSSVGCGLGQGSRPSVAGWTAAGLEDVPCAAVFPDARKLPREGRSGHGCQRGLECPADRGRGGIGERAAVRPGQVEDVDGLVGPSAHVRRADRAPGRGHGGAQAVEQTRAVAGAYLDHRRRRRRSGQGVRLGARRSCGSRHLRPSRTLAMRPAGRAGRPGRFRRTTRPRAVRAGWPPPADHRRGTTTTHRRRPPSRRRRTAPRAEPGPGRLPRWRAAPPGPARRPSPGWFRRTR